jgi:hypothetical protein
MSYMTTRQNINVHISETMNNTQRIYISRSSKDIQVQYDMHIQEASMPVDANGDFIA